MSLTFCLLLTCLTVVCKLPTKTDAKCGCPQQSNTQYGEIKPDSNGLFLVEGDMLLTKEQMDQRRGKHFRNQMREYVWPKGVVYYKFIKADERSKSQIVAAMSDLSNAVDGCVKFKEVSAYEKVHAVAVNVTHTGNCGGKATLGRNIHSHQRLELSLNRCGSSSKIIKGLIQHELLHSLGINHEHTRRDRRKHIKIHWQNVDSGECHNFKIVEGSQDPPMRYEIESIMQYPSYLFSCNGRDTMTTIDGKKIKDTHELTPLDIKKIKFLYKC